MWGSNFGLFLYFCCCFILVDEGREDPNTTISGPSLARQRGVRWRADGGPTLNAGLVALWFYRGSGPVSIAKKPYIFVIFFQGGRSGPRPPSGSTHVQ